MYNEKFSYIYNKYGWDEASQINGIDIILLIENWGFEIKTHLDIACGIGGLCNILHHYGITSEGFDLSPYSIKLAKEKQPAINFFVDDMTTFALAKKYDLITCNGDSLNHLPSIEMVIKTIKNIANHLKPGGIFIFDIVATDNLIPRLSFGPITWQLTRNEKKIFNNITITENNKIIHNEIIELLPIEKEMMIALLLKHNLKIIDCQHQLNENNANAVNLKNYFICEKIIAKQNPFKEAE